VERAGQVHVDQPVPELLVDRVQRAEVARPRVVDQYVEGPQRGRSPSTARSPRRRRARRPRSSARCRPRQQSGRARRRSRRANSSAVAAPIPDALPRDQRGAFELFHRSVPFRQTVWTLLDYIVRNAPST
jgi:hypothetical protein